MTQFVVDNMFRDGLRRIGTNGNVVAGRGQSRLQPGPRRGLQHCRMLCTAERVSGTISYATTPKQAAAWFEGRNSKQEPI